MRRTLAKIVFLFGAFAILIVAWIDEDVFFEGLEDLRKSLNGSEEAKS